LARLIVVAALLCAACQHKAPMYFPPPAAAKASPEAEGPLLPPDGGMNCAPLPPYEDPAVGNNTFSGMRLAAQATITSVDRELLINPQLAQKQERLQWLGDCGGRWFAWRYEAVKGADSRLQSAGKAAMTEQKADAAHLRAEAWTSFVEATARLRDRIDPSDQRYAQPIAYLQTKVNDAVKDCLKAAPDQTDAHHIPCEQLKAKAQTF
jgi:hypothetical protein